MEGVLTAKIKQATVLWFEGFREACCLHRVLVFCLRSRKLLIRTGQCFLLNGLIFLGSIFVLKSVVIPTLQWILPDQWPQISSQESYSCGGILKFYSFLHVGLVQLFYIFWFYPLYIFSFILSNIWYIDIAKYGFVAMGKFGPSMAETVGRKESLNTQRIAHVVKPAGLGGVIFGMAEQVYSVLLLSFFFVEVYATGFIPYIGKALNFLLLSWMYKWNLTEMGLDRRLDFFESNWSFFLGFGNPCVLAIFFFSPLVSYGVMAMLFPLFVLTATGSEAENVIASQRRKCEGAELGRLPIFYAANTLSMRILSFFPLEPQDREQDNKNL
ncbi:protein EI24 homolog isoform X5 [Malania oleifera]|uniref:protein EI24 homolog isoform X5 n=1 Tax=Malania oleifera TaxID=397392 RepID=UPI0025ADEEC6|nr:protein EI24 homolog isoform X5 [Malania oleifera]XP_057978021.1 protein EI24 homolog isoform X5 [Malania oleifera]